MGDKDPVMILHSASLHKDIKTDQYADSGKSNEEYKQMLRGFSSRPGVLVLVVLPFTTWGHIVINTKIEHDRFTLDGYDMGERVLNIEEYTFGMLRDILYRDCGKGIQGVGGGWAEG